MTRGGRLSRTRVSTFTTTSKNALPPAVSSTSGRSNRSRWSRAVAIRARKARNSRITGSRAPPARGPGRAPQPSPPGQGQGGGGGPDRLGHLDRGGHVADPAAGAGQATLDQDVDRAAGAVGAPGGDPLRQQGGAG